MASSLDEICIFSILMPCPINEDGPCIFNALQVESTPHSGASLLLGVRKYTRNTWMQGPGTLETGIEVEKYQKLFSQHKGDKQIAFSIVCVFRDKNSSSVSFWVGNYGLLTSKGFQHYGGIILGELEDILGKELRKFKIRKKMEATITLKKCSIFPD